MRLIDADALKEKIDSMWNGRPLSSLGARILVTIDDAPSIDIPQWTPCSERLPSECDEFLITWTASVTNGPLLAFAEYETDAFLVSGGKWYLEDDMREFKDVDVIAWMPLPKPWKGADDE